MKILVATKVFLELSGVHSSLHCLLCFHATVALELQQSLSDHKASCVYYLALYRKALLTMVCRNRMNLSNQAHSWMHGVRFLGSQIGYTEGWRMPEQSQSKQSWRLGRHPTSTISNRKQTRV